MGMPSFFRRLAAWTRSRRRVSDIEAEMEAHRALAQDELERAGLTPEDAGVESRRRMGNVTIARDDARDVWAARWLDRLRGHVRYSLRGLRREPTFAATAVLTLAFGTAAVTSVFSVVDAELWRQLPYPQADRLLVLQSRATTPLHDNDRLSTDELVEWRRAMPGLSAMAAMGDDSRRSAVRLESTQSMTTSVVSANYFSTLGRPAIAGRLFTDADARQSNAVVLGSRGWRRYFDGDPGLVGRRILVDEEPKVVVGVVETDETAGGESDLFMPIDETNGSAAVVFSAIGRMTPGASADIIRTQLQAVLDRRAKVDPARTGHAAFVVGMSEYFRRTDAGPLYYFLGASIFVLALTIVNLAGLVLARSVRRAPEFALRGALGGGPGAIAGQLATEAACIAVPGCLIGLWLTRQAMGLLGTFVPSDLLWRGAHVTVDERAAALVVAIVVLTIAGLAFPPLRVARRADVSTVKAAGSRGSGLRWAGRVRERLLVTQTALTVVLLVGSALFVRSFLALTHVPLGFDASDGWSMRVSLGSPAYRDNALKHAYAGTLLAQTRAIPGIRSAAIATTSPLRSGWVVLSGPPGTVLDSGLTTVYRAVTADYFQTIGTPIIRGRALADSDVAGAPPVAVVNDALARQLFHGADPIGRDVVIKGVHAPVPVSTVTIVGVAGDIKEVGLKETSVGDVYVPLTQKPAVDLELIVRGNGASATMPAALRAAAAKADPAVPVTGVSTIDRRVSIALQSDRFNVLLVSGFAMIAVLVAAIGIYGAMAYAAVARAREYGVRLALGASPAALWGHALWQAVRVGVIGGGAGIALTLAGAAWIGDAPYFVPGKQNGLLYQVRATDPFSLSIAAGGIILVAVAAGLLPARRLARIDPVTTLRAD